MKGYGFIMTYEFRKMPLQKVPYEVETIVTKAVTGYLKKLNKTDSLKSISYGMDYYDEPTCDLFQLGCHIGGRGKKYKHIIYIYPTGIYIFHIKGSATELKASCEDENFDPVFSRRSKYERADGSYKIDKDIKPDFFYPIKSLQLHNGIADYLIDPEFERTSGIRKEIGKKAYFHAANAYIGMKAADDVDSKIKEN